jgi:hypothetical protein
MSVQILECMAVFLLLALGLGRRQTGSTNAEHAL